MDKLRVFLADWQVLFREGVHFTLCGEEDMEVVGEGTSSEEALNFIETHSPDIAVLSMKDGKRGGVAATRCVKKNTPPVSIVLVTDINDEEHLPFIADSAHTFHPFNGWHNRPSNALHRLDQKCRGRA